MTINKNICKTNTEIHILFIFAIFEQNFNEHIENMNKKMSLGYESGSKNLKLSKQEHVSEVHFYQSLKAF